MTTRRQSSRALALALGLLLVPLAALAEDWPQWRGPERDGVCKETGLLKEWPTTGPKLVWQVKDCGLGYSTPTVAAGRIYGMGYQGYNEVVWAKDEKTGTDVWATKIAAALSRQQLGGYPGSRCSPTVDGDYLYAVGAAGDLVCLSVAKGEIKWRKHFRKDFNGRMMSDWGFSESPLVDGDKVICTPGGDQAALVALNKKDGKVLWRAPVSDCGGAGYASIVIAEFKGIKQYITLLGRCLVSIDANKGKMVWVYARIANTTANIPTSVVADDHIICSTGYGQGGTAVLQMIPKGTGIQIKEVFYHNNRSLQNHHGGLVRQGDYIYLCHGHNAGNPVCYNWKTNQIQWKQSQRSLGEGSACLLFADGHLYIRYEKGTMVLAEANPLSFKLKGKFRLPYDSGFPSWPHPVIAHGKLYIRDQDVLMCFDVKATES
jgi:outer membrane protein assembly factor BamB